MYKQIKCGICHKRLKDYDTMTFDAIAKKHNWVATKRGYICPDCKPKEKPVYSQNNYRKGRR